MSLADPKKANGRHYTPDALASFVAAGVARHLPLTATGLRVLDPACGDGTLLLAMLQTMGAKRAAAARLHGFDTDAVAVAAAKSRLRGHPAAGLTIEARDFLSIQAGPQLSLLGSVAGERPQQYDVVIANPPYVRTQVLGGKKAQELSARHGLSGRVDLFHVFVSALTASLAEGGTLGLIVSNRFLYTQSGRATRELLLAEYELHTVIDLGDTKLFEAAVLPAVVLATRRRARGKRGVTEFLRAYERRSPPAEDVPTQRSSVLAALSDGVGGIL